MSRCRRQVPVLQLGEELSLCANCLRQGANVLDLWAAHACGLPWTFQVWSDYTAGPVTWEDVYDGDGHFLFTLYARGALIDPAQPEAGVYDQPGYHPFGYPGVEERDGYPEIVADAERLSLSQVAEACRQWLRAHGLPADGPLVIENGPDTFTFPAPGALPVVTHHKETYAAEGIFEGQVAEYRMRCEACGVEIVSNEPHLGRCPWCGTER